MKKLLRILPLIFLLSACSLGAAGSNGAQTPIVRSNSGFTLTINSPADLSTVSQSTVDLQGKVSKDAVLSVDDNNYVLNSGNFSEPVQLQEGINAIQIVASDMDGNEIDLIMTITYQP